MPIVAIIGAFRIAMVEGKRRNDRTEIIIMLEGDKEMAESSATVVKQ
jgi:hypothetical protein